MPPLARAPVRVYCSMIGDMFHSGHVMFLRQVRRCQRCCRYGSCCVVLLWYPRVPAVGAYVIGGSVRLLWTLAGASIRG